MSKVRVNWGKAPNSQAVRLFLVRNTANNAIYVLARDSATAMAIAQTANHILGTSSISADHYSRHAGEIKGPFGAELTMHWAQIDLAISRCLEGTLHLDNGEVSIGGEAIT